PEAGERARRPRLTASLAVNRVLRLVGDVVDRVLDRGLRLVGLALAPELVVVGQAAGRFLDPALGLIDVLVAHRAPLGYGTPVASTVQLPRETRSQTTGSRTPRATRLWTS